MACRLQWHSHGYDIAKWQAHKIDLLAPVWFQIVPSLVTTGDDAPILCSIEGAHDMDQGAVRRARAHHSYSLVERRALQ